MIAGCEQIEVIQGLPTCRVYIVHFFLCSLLGADAGGADGVSVGVYASLCVVRWTFGQRTRLLRLSSP